MSAEPPKNLRETPGYLMLDEQWGYIARESEKGKRTVLFSALKENASPITEDDLRYFIFQRHKSPITDLAALSTMDKAKLFALWKSLVPFPQKNEGMTPAAAQPADDPSHIPSLYPQAPVHEDSISEKPTHFAQYLVDTNQSSSQRDQLARTVSRLRHDLIIARVREKHEVFETAEEYVNAHLLSINKGEAVSFYSAAKPMVDAMIKEVLDHYRQRKAFGPLCATHRIHLHSPMMQKAHDVVLALRQKEIVNYQHMHSVNMETAQQAIDDEFIKITDRGLYIYPAALPVVEKLLRTLQAEPSLETVCENQHIALTPKARSFLNEKLDTLWNFLVNQYQNTQQCPHETARHHIDSFYLQKTAGMEESYIVKPLGMEWVDYTVAMCKGAIPEQVAGNGHGRPDGHSPKSPHKTPRSSARQTH